MQDILIMGTAIRQLIHYAAQQKDPQSPRGSLLRVSEQVWRWHGQWIKGYPAIDNVNTQTRPCVMCTLHFHIAATLGIGVGADIGQDLAYRQFNLGHPVRRKANGG